jgi:hypothetical protein
MYRPSSRYIVTYEERPHIVVSGVGSTREHLRHTPSPALDEVIDAVEILRDLADRLGEDNLRRLLDAL